MSGGGSFFDFHERVTRRAPKPQQSPLSPSTKPIDGSPPLTVSELTAKIDRALKSDLPASLLVKGEVSNFKAHGSSGHSYFTLKDANACINCVIWRSDMARVKFLPKDGMELLATGNVAVYAQQGKYQLYVTKLQPLGQGALELAFQQLRAKLEAEGMFAPERRKPLPRYPLRIALVTSSQTAALQDMLKVLRRYPWLQLFIYHAPVQGDGAAEKIAAAIHHLSAQHQTARSVDVILLARGGGSLEDLWEFNEEIVARAIVASLIPIVTGIGHEVDTSIADLAADHHAHTPTEAAQTIVQLWKSARDVLDTSSIRLRRGQNAIVVDAQQRLAGIRRHEMFRRPMDRVNQLRQLLDDRQRAVSLGIGERLRIAQRQVEQLNERLERHRPETLLARVRQRLAELDRALFDSARSRIRVLRDRLQDIVAMLADRNPRHEIRLRSQQTGALADRLQRAAVGDIERRIMGLDGLQGRLEALAPQNVLRRGYSLTTLKKSGAIIRDAKQLRPGERIITRFADGTAESVVEDSKQLPLFE